MIDTTKIELARFPETLTFGMSALLYNYSEVAQTAVLAGERVVDWFTNYGSGVGCVAAFTAFAGYLDKLCSEGEGSSLGRIVSTLPALGVIGWELRTIGGSIGTVNDPQTGDPIDMLYAAATGAAVIGLGYLTRIKNDPEHAPYVLQDIGNEIKELISSKFSPRKSQQKSTISGAFSVSSQRKSPQCHCLEDKCEDNL